MKRVECNIQPSVMPDLLQKESDSGLLTKGLSIIYLFHPQAKGTTNSYGLLTKGLSIIYLFHLQAKGTTNS